MQPYYISPEVLEGKYDESCDIWSAGVILYILLSGVPPFFGNTDPEILESVKKGAFTFNIPEFKGVSDGAKDLITKMLTKPDKRLKANEILQHPWIQMN
jgi:calcium-dependent protein kinase